MPAGDLKIYALLSRLGFPRGYRGKIFLVALVGTHLPLVALVCYLLLTPPVSPRPDLQILALLVCATLVGTAGALYALNGLLAPVRLTARSVRAYLDEGETPDLPTGLDDEAGRLMADVRYALENLDATVRSLEDLSVTDPLTGLLERLS